MSFPAGCLRFVFPLKNKTLSLLRTLFSICLQKNIVDRGRLRNKERNTDRGQKSEENASKPFWPLSGDARGGGPRPRTAAARSSSRQLPGALRDTLEIKKAWQW